jgi:thiamine-phosphate pyrophosphorylase
VSPAQPDVFYPVVPDAAWVARCVRLGARTVQLRLKDAGPEAIRAAIAECLQTCDRHGATLIVNDYWQDAIALGARWVHLGQEDLAGADVASIRAAGIKLGISTHDEAELATALASRPDHVALGPIYPTRLKAMRFGPQGLDRIGAWKARIGELQLVAIGGITLERAPAVLAAGAQSIAAVTDFTLHPDPDARIRAWVDWAAAVRSETA